MAAIAPLPSVIENHDVVADKINEIVAALNAQVIQTDALEVRGSIGRYARPGDEDFSWSSTLTGPAKDRPVGTGPLVVNNSTLGAALRIRGEDVPAGPGFLNVGLRADFAIDATRTYRVTYIFQRTTDPSDPAGHAVELRLQPLAGDKTATAGASILLASLTPVAADGPIIRRFTVGRADAPGTKDATLSTSVRYLVPFIRVYGNGQETDISVIGRIEDVTEAVASGSDVTTLTNKVTQVEGNTPWSLASSGGSATINGDGSSYQGYRTGTPLTAYANNQEFTAVFPVDSTVQSPPLTVDGLENLSIRDAAGGLIPPGWIVAGRVYKLRLYNITSGTKTARIVSGQLGGDKQLLGNLFVNGQLDPNGEMNWFGDLLSSNGSHIVTPQAASAGLAAYGVQQMVQFPVITEGASQTGWYQNVKLDRGSVLGIVPVELVSGDWTGVSCRMMFRFSDGTSSTTSFTAYEELSSSVRLYYGIGALGGGKICTRVELYASSPVPRTSVYNVGGVWASWLKRTPVGNWQDTAWPDWSKNAILPRPPVLVVKKGNFQLFRETVGNKLRSLTACFAGDSNMWAGVASNITANSPRAQQLSDPRNLNFDPVSCPSFFNLVGDFLGRAFGGGTITTGGASPDPEGAWIAVRSLVHVNPCRDANIRYVHRWTGSRCPKPTPIAEDNAFHDEYLQIVKADNTALEFDFTGDDIRIVYARNSSTAGTLQLSYTIDGGPVQTMNLDGSVAWGQEAQITTAFGPHTIRLWNTGTGSFIRIESIGHNRRLLVRNQGIYGSNLGQWLKSANRLYLGIRPEDEFVFPMIGTNIYSLDTTSARFKESLRTWWSDMIADGHKVIPMTPCPEYNAGETYPPWEKALVYRELAREMDLDLIDHFAAFMALPELTIRSAVQRNADDYIGTDDTHVTDLGNRLFYRTWVHSLGLSALADLDPDVKLIKRAVLAHAQSGQAFSANSITGTTADTQLRAYTIPGGRLKANDSIKITALWDYTNSANSKRFTVLFGGVAYTIFNTSTGDSCRTETVIWMAGSTTAQTGLGSSAAAAGTAGARVTSAIDTSADVVIALNGKLSVTGETITSRAVTIEIIPGSL